MSAVACIYSSLDGACRCPTSAKSAAAIPSAGWQRPKRRSTLSPSAVLASAVGRTHRRQISEPRLCVRSRNDGPSANLRCGQGAGGDLAIEFRFPYAGDLRQLWDRVRYPGRPPPACAFFVLPLVARPLAARSFRDSHFGSSDVGVHRHVPASRHIVEPSCSIFPNGSAEFWLPARQIGQR